MVIIIKSIIDSASRRENFPTNKLFYSHMYVRERERVSAADAGGVEGEDLFYLSLHLRTYQHSKYISIISLSLNEIKCFLSLMSSRMSVCM